MDFFARDTMGKQLVRSSDSISSNIAEGYGRFFYKENRQFCYFFRGSLMETKGWITKAYKRSYISETEYKDLISSLELIHLKLNAYIKSIGTKIAAESKSLSARYQ